MKKLMIAAAIVCAAAMSQAATTKWAANSGTAVWFDGYKNTSDSYEAKGLAGASIYLIAASAASKNYTTQAALVSAFQNATTENPFNLADYAVKGSGVGRTGTSGGGLGKMSTQITAFQNTNDDFEWGKPYDFYLATVVTDGDKQYLYVTDLVPKNAGADANTTITITAAPGTTSKAFYGDAEFSKAGWYTTAAVPEPTSGLLLLLGVAGLALRRRRA